MIENWKNENVFKKQLELNKRELSSSSSYPPHWNAAINFIAKLKPKTLLDVGCGCGSFYELCKIELPNIKYIGVDYSEEAINLAKQSWGYNEFYVKDYNDLDSEFIKSFDLIHLGALLDVLPNGDEALRFILSLNPKSVLIGRMRLTDKESYFEKYSAYDEIETFAYYHNYKHFLNLCDSNNYEIIRVDNNFLLNKVN